MGWPVATGRGGVMTMYVAYGSYLKCAEARIASIAIGSSTRFCASPLATIVSGTGVGSIHTPFSWFFGLVTYSTPGWPAQLVEPTIAPRQYCVCTAAHGLPPRFAMKVFR